MPRRLLALASCCCVLAACGVGGGSAKLKKISPVFFVDDVPEGKASPHLYWVADGKRVVVDRGIISYVSSGCLVYVSVRPPASQVVFAALPGKIPAAIATSDSFRPWHLDWDGLRRFNVPRTEIDGRTVLTMEFVEGNHMCSAAFKQPEFREGWNEGEASATQIARMESHSTTITFDVHGADSVGNTTLSDEVQNGHLTIVDELLRAGADVNAPNDFGITPVMVAIAYQPKGTAVLERLLDAGADIDAQDNRGMTALMHAAFYARKDAAKVLLARGADPAVRDNMGRSALTVARPNDKELAQILSGR